MNIPQIAKKYNISESFLMSKDDGYMIIAESLTDVKTEIQIKYPNDSSLVSKVDKLIEFIVDIKQSSY